MSPLVKFVGYRLHAPHNLALLRRFAVNALNRAGSSKQSLRQKFKAAMDDCFMLRVLAAALPDPNEDENLAVNSFEMRTLP